MPEVAIGSSALRASITDRGAELTTLETGDGRQLLWDGDPQWWTGRAPLLFPIVGRLPADTALIDGIAYPLPQHGFARTSTFTLQSADARSCTWQLSASPDLLARYPRAFRLGVAYAIDGSMLSVTATVTNEDARVMPFSFGFHPAFRWPLSPEATREDHVLLFSDEEATPIHWPVDGLLSQATEPCPVVGRRLDLSDALFAKGALIFDRLQSRSVVFQSPGGSRLTISFPGMPHLGIWTKPGAPFLCVEPWQGYAAPEGFAGELATKPGIVRLEPDASASYAMTIEVAP